MLGQATSEAYNKAQEQKSLSEKSLSAILAFAKQVACFVPGLVERAYAAVGANNEAKLAVANWLQGISTGSLSKDYLIASAIGILSPFAEALSLTESSERGLAFKLAGFKSIANVCKFSALYVRSDLPTTYQTNPGVAIPLSGILGSTIDVITEGVKFARDAYQIRCCRGRYEPTSQYTPSEPAPNFDGEAKLQSLELVVADANNGKAASTLVLDMKQ